MSALTTMLGTTEDLTSWSEIHVIVAPIEFVLGEQVWYIHVTR